MTTALSRILEMLRLMVIVALSVASGIVVALTTRNVEEAWLEIFAFFMIFATPMIVAWLLFRIIPSSYRIAGQRSSAAHAQEDDRGHGRCD
jgi:hypothetical protein